MKLKYKLSIDKWYFLFNIHSVGNFISITIKNYYNGKIVLNSEGLPTTNKENKNYHGYGIKSIQAIVQKYNGNLSISTEEQIFKLNLLLPIQN